MSTSVLPSMLSRNQRAGGCGLVECGAALPVEVLGVGEEQR